MVDEEVCQNHQEACYCPWVDERLVVPGRDESRIYDLLIVEPDFSGCLEPWWEDHSLEVGRVLWSCGKDGVAADYRLKHDVLLFLSSSTDIVATAFTPSS